MSSRHIDIDISELQNFFARAERAAKGDFRKELELFLEGLGDEFLRVIQDEIERRKVMDSRLLLASFEKNTENNIWIIRDGGLTLEVGTNVEYASYVNDGHWTNPKGVDARWVPGSWNGDRFIYDSDAKTGMLLRQKWIEGRHYWEGAIRIMEKMLPGLMEAKITDWLQDYLGI